LRPHQNLFSASPISIQTLNVAHVADALKRQGLTQRFARDNWPKFLQQAGALRGLWEELQLLSNRRRPGQMTQRPHAIPAAPDTLATLALAVSRDGALCPCQTVYRAVGPGTEKIFSHFDPTIRFATTETNLFPLFSSFCPAFGPAEAIAVIQKIDTAAFATAVSSGVVSLSTLFAWLVDHRTEILKTPAVKATLVTVPIYPSGGSYQKLNGISLPGNFTDPLQLAALLDVKALPNHHDFLRELGIQELSFPVYVTSHLTPALARTDLSPEKRRAAAILLASRRSEISEDDASRRSLAALALVECAHDQFHAAADVYFPSAIVTEVLGDKVLQARLPAGHETIFTEMFKWLGVAEHPRFEDIVGRIKTLVATPPDASSLASLRVIFGHLAKRMQTEEPPAALKILRSLAWLPARQQTARWFKPAEIFAEFSFYLFDSQAEFLSIDRSVQNTGTAFLNFLGVESSPSVSQVVNHLLHCAREKKEVNQGVYLFLNNNAEDAVILQLRSNPWLLLNDGRYHYSSEVFWAEHPFGRYRVQLGQDLRKFNDLFQKLNVGETANHQDALKVLAQLTEEFGSRNRALDETAHAVALACWRMLESALETKTISPNDLARLKDVRCVPNAAHNLTQPTWIFFEDRAGLAAKFAGFLATNAIPRPLGASKAMAAAGVRTLATAVEVSLLECRNPAEDKTLAQRIQDRRDQITRVLDARAAHADPSEKLTHLDGIRFESAELVSISYKLNAFGRTLDSTPEDCPALFRKAQNLLLFVATGGRVPWTSIARELALALYLPWASNPNSILRSKLRAEPTTPETPNKLLAELEMSLPTAMLFLKKLAKVEIKRNGIPVRKLERVKQEETDSILLTDGDSANDSIWHLLRGNFSATAQELRQLHPNRIEKKRSADVTIAIPATQRDSGLLCATLPTQQRTGLPFHINADFYPTEDRKRIILEQDFQSEWNRAALKSSATILAGSLNKLPDLLGHQRLWNLLARLQAVSAEANAGRGEEIYGQFWAELAPAIPKSPVVFTSLKQWCKPTEVFYLLEKSERAALPVMESIGLKFVHEDYRTAHSERRS
jgi:hypothetical protein